MKSFMQSLPSHRRKEKGRKSRHHQKSSRSNSNRHQTTASSLDGRDEAHAESSCGTSLAHYSQSQSPGSIVEATQVQYRPPPRAGLPRVSLENNAKREEEEGADYDHDDDDDVAEAAAEGNHAGSSEEAVVEATQIQFHPSSMMMMAAASSARKPSPSAGKESVGVGNLNHGAKKQLQVSPVHSSLPLALAGSRQPEYDKAYDEETVLGSIMGSPLRGDRDHDESHKPEANNEPVIEAGDSGEATKPIYCEPCENHAGEGVDKPRDSTSRGRHSAERNLSLETEPRGNMRRRNNESTSRNLTLETGSRENPRVNSSRGRHSAERNLSLESKEQRGGRESKSVTEINLSLETTEPATNTHTKSGGTRDASFGRTTHNSSSTTSHAEPDRDKEGTNHAEPGHVGEDGKVPDGEEQSSLHGAHSDDSDTEFVLTTTDIGDCIGAMEVAIKIMKADPSRDPFHNIDIEQWHSCFEEFEKYVSALGDPSSTEAGELQQINRDKVFAIFDRGMDVNHCNAVFIYNMIRSISSGIDAHGKSPSHDGCKKLDHLAASLDMIFGVNEDSDDDLSTVVSVSISKVEGGDSTALKFSMSLEPSSQSDETTLSTTQQPPAPGTLPPHLQAMSQIFARFAEEKTRPLQSQLDSTRKTLAATREGAMDLQRQAVKLQDDMQDAQTEAEEAKPKQDRAEAELGRQKYEFERREESFERVKEHYKAEIERKETVLANMKGRYERELKEAKDELARVKHRHTDQKSSERRSTDQRLDEQRHTKQRNTKQEERADQRSTDQRKRKESGSRRDDHQTKHHRTEHHRRHDMPQPNPIATINAATAEAGNDEISPSIPRNIEFDPFDTDPSKKRSETSDRQSRHSTGSRKSRSAPYELQPPRRPHASEPRTRDTNRKTDQSMSRKDEQLSEHSSRYGRMGATKQRNPLKSPTENSHADHSTDANFRDKKESRNRREKPAKKEERFGEEKKEEEDDENVMNGARKKNNVKRKDHRSHEERIEGEEGKQTSNVASSNKRNVTKNPYLKQPKPSKSAAKATDSDGEPGYAYQEVVRGRAAREALPGYECEECRKFMNALGNGYDRDELVMECSRHRARHAPPSTPPGFWNLTFIDSVGSRK